MRCDELAEDKAAVLYGEADVIVQRRVADHGASCPACRDELADLRGVRRDLAAWKLPPTLRPRRPWRRARVLPDWALPAAAALLVAAGGGWATWRSEARHAAVAQRLSEQEHRHREELAALRAEFDQALASPRAMPAAMSDTELLARVQELIAASEGRQRAVLRAGFDLLEQRREYDMTRVKAGFSYLEGRSGRDMANAMKMVNYVLASQPGTPSSAAEPR